SPPRRWRTGSPCGPRCGCERFRAPTSSGNSCGACPFRARNETPGGTGVIESREVELRWRASKLTRAVATCAGFALAAAVIGGRWQLIAFAAPLLGVLCSITWQRPAPTVRVYGEPDSQRRFETEAARLKVWATPEKEESPAEVRGVSGVELTVSAVEGMQLEVAEDEGALSSSAKSVVAVAQRWGRYPIRARVDVVARGGLLTGTGTVDAAHVVVFPLTPPQATAIPQTELLDRLGTHLTRYIGPGVEYADIRPYVP